MTVARSKQRVGNIVWSLFDNTNLSHFWTYMNFFVRYVAFASVTILSSEFIATLEEKPCCLINGSAIKHNRLIFSMLLVFVTTRLAL